MTKIPKTAITVANALSLTTFAARGVPANVATKLTSAAIPQVRELGSRQD